VRKVRKEQVYIHTNILQMPLSMRQFSKEFVKKLIIYMFYVFLSPLALQQHFLLTMCLVETLGTKCKVFMQAIHFVGKEVALEWA
jgi:hypothetical protein